MVRTFGNSDLFFAQGGLSFQCSGCVAEDGYTQQMQQILAVGLWGPKAGATPGEGSKCQLEEKEEEGWSRSQGRGSAGEGTMLKQCCGQQDHPCAPHICILELSPLPQQQGQAPIGQQSYQCFRRRSCRV